MKRAFKSYYLPWLIVSTFIVGMTIVSVAIKAEFPNYQVIIPTMLLGTLGLTIFSGGIHHFFYEYVKPRRLKKIISRPKMQYLNDLGFKFDNENYIYFAVYKSYYLTIAADSSAQTGDSIILNAFIIPTETQVNLLTDLQKKYELNFNENFYWLTKRIGFLFNTPNRDKLEKELNQLIDDIRFRNIKPTPVEGELD